MELIQEGRNFLQQGRNIEEDWRSEEDKRRRKLPAIEENHNGGSQ